MQKKRNRNNRSRSNVGSHTYVGKDTTKIFSIRSDGISKRKIKSNDF